MRKQKQQIKKYPLDKSNIDIYLKLFGIKNSFNLPIPLNNKIILENIKKSGFLEDYIDFISKPYYNKIYSILIETSTKMAQEQGDEKSLEVAVIFEDFLKKDNINRLKNITNENFIFQRNFLQILIEKLELNIEPDKDGILRLYLGITPNDFIPEMTKLENGEQFIKDYYEVELNLK